MIGSDDTASISSEERLKRVLDTDAVGVMFFTYDGTLVDANDAFLRMTGYTRGQVTSKTLHWRDLTPPEYIAASEEQMRRFEQTGRIGPYEKEYLHADGSRRWMHFTGRDLGDGTIAEYVIDLTEQKRTEEGLRESERLLSESEGQFAKELADTQLLQTVSTRLISQENVGELYKEIAVVAKLVMRSDAATIQSYDEERDELRLLASVGLHPESVELWKIVPAGDSTFCEHVRRSGTRIVVNDVHASDLFKNKESLKAYELSGITAVQSTPLVSRDGRLLGMLSTQWQTQREPLERELQVFEVLARQAADSLERARAEEALRKHGAWLRGQAGALQTAVNDESLETSLGMLVRAATEALGPGTRAAFYLASENNTTLHHVVGMSAEYAEAVDGFLIGPESLACGLATHSGEPILTTDVQTDPRWEPWRWMAERFDYRGCWSFPISSVAGKMIGTLAIYSGHARKPTQGELELASLLTNTASIIISRHTEAEVRKRAEEALRESEAQLRSLNEQLEERLLDRMHKLQAEVHERRTAEEQVKNLLRQLVTAEEQQRQRIARELHDTFGQQLAALHMNIEAFISKTNGDAEGRQSVERIRETFDRLNSSVEFLAWELRPPSLDLLGLDSAMETYVREWSQQFGVEAIYEGVAVSALRLDADAETNLYRIFQEALQNVHKHAAADRVNVVFERSDGHAVLIIEDNGKGYDSEAQNGERGMGLINMRERAALIGGIVEIESQAGEGTTVFVRVPVAANGH